MTRDGIRAVALAAIMMFSVVAMGAAFAGSTAAQADEPDEGEAVLLNRLC